MEICGQTGREYDTNNPSMGCGGEINPADEDVMMVGAISFCVLCYENLSEADQEWVATEEETCVKCYTNEDVEQCSKCGKYTCVDCDGGDMGTYAEDGHTYCENCFPEEKVYKCSDCDAWVTATEECCGSKRRSSG